MFEALKREVCAANLELVAHHLVTLTWGNASAITDDRKFVIIKPSGVSYATMKPEDMVVTDLEGNVVEGDYRPSSDLATHLELYKRFSQIKGVVHTHSLYATALAQAEMELPCMGTTHADHFYGNVPCTRQLTEEAVSKEYELNTGKVIVETFDSRKIDPMAVPGVLVSKHGPFTWGSNVGKAVENAVVLDSVAHMYLLGLQYNPNITSAPQYLLDKHYYRKHGPNAYYGQK